MPLYSSPILTADGRRLPTRGNEVIRWIERSVRLGPGDFYGQPFRLTSYQKRWIRRLYEFYPETNLYRYKRALFGTAKGNGKTPFEGAVGAEGMLGPTAPLSPLVLVAAAGLEQSNLVFGDLKVGITHDDSPMKPFVTAFQLSIQRADGEPGEIKRVAAAEGTNDGPRATRLLCDEVHEWKGIARNVFTILDGAIGKRENAFEVLISTAGSDPDSLLGEQYGRGKAIATGEIQDDATLFEWYEIPDWIEVPEKIENDEDLAQWREAIWWANPALAEARFLHEDYIRSRFDGAQVIERYKWLRYHGNRWTRAEKRWLPPGAWDACRRDGIVNEKGRPAILVFSGTYDGDSAGLVAVFDDGSVIRLGSWEPGMPNEDGSLQPPEDYAVPRGEVQKVVKDAWEFYKVSTMVCNPNGWHGEVAGWISKYGEKRVVVFDWLHQARRKHDACSRFFTAVGTKAVGHDGDPTIARHLDSCTEKESEEGAWITKGSRNGPPIDLAVCSVIGWDQLETRPAPKKSRAAAF